METEKQIAEKFALHLKLARVKAGLSQEELAERIGVTRALINNWENCKAKGIKFEHIASLKEKVGLSVEYSY